MNCPFCFINQPYGGMCRNCSSLNSFHNDKLYGYQFEININYEIYFIQYDIADDKTNIYKEKIRKPILSFNGTLSLTPKNAVKKLPIILTFS